MATRKSGTDAAKSSTGSGARTPLPPKPSTGKGAKAGRGGGGRRKDLPPVLTAEVVSKSLTQQDFLLRSTRKGLFIDLSKLTDAQAAQLYTFVSGLDSSEWCGVAGTLGGP